MAEGLANVPDLLSDITAPGTTVRMIGTQTINGEVATGYQATVDPAKALASVPGLMAGLGSSGRSGHHGIPATVPVRLWADSTGRLVRASVVLGHKGSAATPQQVVMSVTVTGYDQAFSVTPPAASTTLSLPAGALKQLFGSLGGAGALGGLLTPGTSSTTTTAGA